LFDADERICWRAIDALGRAAVLRASAAPDAVCDWLRRLVWFTNDDSGNVGWYAPQAMGEILVNVPVLLGQFGGPLAALLTRSPFETGAHWAVARVATACPDAFAGWRDVLVTSLHASEPFRRALAAMALVAMKNADLVAADDEDLREDETAVRLYDFTAGDFVTLSVGRLVTVTLEVGAVPGELRCYRAFL